MMNMSGMNPNQNMMNMGMMGNMGGNMGMNPMMSNVGGNMGMNPMMGNMGGNMGMNPMMGNMGGNMGMNPMMGNMSMNPMMGIPGMTTTVSIEDAMGWNLLFENQNNRQIVNIKISPDKYVKEAISAYLLKINETNVDEFKFIFNNKRLFPEMKISQTGLINGSKILVISQRNLKGAKNN